MRVLVLSSAFPNPTRPAYGVFVRERARHVAEHCETVVVAPIPWFPFNRLFRGADRAGAPPVVRDGDLTVYHPRFLCVPAVTKCLDGLLYFLSLLPVVARMRRHFDFDLIDAHFSYPDGAAAVLLGRVFRRPVVVTLRGSHDLRNAAFRLRRPQIRSALRAAARVVAVSESLAKFAIELGVPAEQVRVIPNGVDPEQFAPGDRTAARAALGLPSDRRILLGIGNLLEGKGHHRILETLPAVIARRPDVLYVAVGGSASRGYQRQLDDLVTRGGLAHHVRFVGSRPHQEVPCWLAAADLFCLATAAEGWSNAITEALACGVPVVTTRVGGNAEIVREGRDGFLVPYWDAEAFQGAMLTALDTRWDRQEISARARATGWTRTAEQVAQQFQEVLADGAAPTPSGWSPR